MNADDILNTLADLLADRVAARLSARPAIYSSTALPPGITRRTFHARIGDELLAYLRIESASVVFEARARLLATEEVCRVAA